MNKQNKSYRKTAFRLKKSNNVPAKSSSTAPKKTLTVLPASQRECTSSQSSLFKFRRYRKVEGGNLKKAKHPKLIVEETEQEYGFMGLTESPKRGHHKNIELTNNPQKGNSRKAYIREEVRHDIKDNFGDVLPDYNLTEKDIDIILQYLEKRKKKKPPIGGSH